MRIALLILLMISSLFSQKLIFKNIDSSVRDNISNYFVSEKFDGIRGIWNGVDMLTKNGNRIEIPQCFRDKLANISLKSGEFIEGELWSGYHSFENTSKIIRLKNPKCEDYDNIKYLLFNAKLDDSSDFLENLAKISSNLPPNSPISVIPQVKIHSANELDDLLKNIISKGGEGLIVRDFHIAYKLKAQNDAECEVIGYLQGNGRLKGKVGAIICKSLEDKNHNIKQGLIFRIGSGMSDKMRANPPKIGTIITYQFNSLSKNGIPKHTRFKRIYDEK